MGAIKIAVIVLGLMGFVFSLLLAFLSKRLKVKDDPRVAKVLSVLPGLNCGACGFSGCRPFAEAVTKECKLFSGCLPGGTEVNDKIVQILGITGCISGNQQIVICHCGAISGEKKVTSSYYGPQTCKAAHITAGAIDCAYGCLGFGDCIEVCPTGALSLDNTRIRVNFDKCIGCGKCIQVCPRNLFELISRKNMDFIYVVSCSNKEKAVNVKRVCSRGCIGCGICTKVENSPYYLKNNLSTIDYNKNLDNTALEEGKNKCPTKCILEINA